MKKYIKILRIDHWIKQLFIFPGCVCALLLSKSSISVIKLTIAFLATCCIASANYSINEYLDAEFDRYHPTKKNRSLVEADVNGKVVWLIWFVLGALGILLGKVVNIPTMIMLITLSIMGILYNCKPIRTKDIAFLDVLTESINNAIRFMIGWFAISESTMAPCSVVIGYWMGGAFLMATKRYAEYRMINDKSIAGKYRRSFQYYTEQSLLISAFFYAMCSVFFVGIFLIKYKIELIIVMPIIMGLFCYYFYISFKNDSAVQKPEKLYKEKGLMIYVAIVITVACILLFVKIPILEMFNTTELINI